MTPKNTVPNLIDQLMVEYGALDLKDLRNKVEDHIKELVELLDDKDIVIQMTKYEVERELDKLYYNLDKLEDEIKKGSK